MCVPADTLRLHLKYAAWATRRLLGIASQLSREELCYDFKTADRSILNTLAHVYASERTWLQRLQQVSPSAPLKDGIRDLQNLLTEWPQLHERWETWSSGLTDTSAQELLTYMDLKGNQYTQPIWQIVLHVVNHGTHHRGQVSGFLRSLGHTPPPMDLIFFYRLLVKDKNI